MPHECRSVILYQFEAGQYFDIFGLIIEFLQGEVTVEGLEIYLFGAAPLFIGDSSFHQPPEGFGVKLLRGLSAVGPQI